MTPALSLRPKIPTRPDCSRGHLLAPEMPLPAHARQLDARQCCSGRLLCRRRCLVPRAGRVAQVDERPARRRHRFTGSFHQFFADSSGRRRRAAPTEDGRGSTAISRFFHDFPERRSRRPAYAWLGQAYGSAEFHAIAFYLFATVVAEARSSAPIFCARYPRRIA